jgi:hypothetical protein
MWGQEKPSGVGLMQVPPTGIRRLTSASSLPLRIPDAKYQMAIRASDARVRSKAALHSGFLVRGDIKRI